MADPDFIQIAKQQIIIDDLRKEIYDLHGVYNENKKTIFELREEVEGLRCKLALTNAEDLRK